METTAAQQTADSAGTATGGTAQKRLAAISLIAAAYTYGLVVFGGIVRITGSGMGCGEDWPRCNGEWIPPFTFETVIEYTHRLLAAGIGLVMLAVFGYAVLHRRANGVSGRGGLMRPLGLAAGLLVIQAALGAITVRLELPTSVTVAHFIVAMLFMGALIVVAARGGVLGAIPASPSHSAARRSASWAMTAAAIGLIVVAFGAVTANTPGAPAACLGFPLCSGQIVPPAGATTAEIHWAHRIAAFALLFVALAAVLSGWRGGVARPVRRAASISTALIVAQVVVAAVLVLMRLPQGLQALHLAVGGAVWFALAVWAALARLELTAAGESAGESVDPDAARQ